jgi:uncharacterized protein YndB with AHSA1/START domain
MSAPTKLEGRELVFTRTLGAPRSLVFRAWTDADQFERWFGPHGATMPFRTLDPRPGGILHFCHRFSDRPDVWVRGTYEEVVEPDRLVFTVGFSDEAGNALERPGFPREMRITVTFEEDGDGTRMTVRHAGLVVDQGEGQGWKEGLDRLEALLRSRA